MNDAIATSTAARARLARLSDRAVRVWNVAVDELEPSEWRIPDPLERARIVGLGEADVQAGLDELVEVGLVRHTRTEADRMACYEIDETMAYNTAAPPQPQPFVRWCRH